MKLLFTSLFVIASLSVWAQNKSTVIQSVPKQEVTPQQITTQQVPQQEVNPRSASNSAQVSSSPLPYNVDDKYMGRKSEFLNMMIIPELPSDFPVYDKAWGVKEYNGVVDAYFSTHLDILKEKVKQKVVLLNQIK